MSSKFNEIRTKFGSTFFNVRGAISNNPPPVEEIKMLLQDSFIDLKPQIVHVNTIKKILDIVRDKCTLTDISYLKTIVEEFDIKEAKDHIQTYKKSIEEFCRTVSLRLCLGESFRMLSSSTFLKCETATFILDWNPDDCVVNDIKDVLSECFERLSQTVQIEIIKTINEKTEEIEDLKSKLRQYEGNINYIITFNLKYLLLLDEEILELNESQKGRQLSYEGVKKLHYTCV